MFQNVSILSITVGFLISQAISAILAFVMVICFFYIYGNKVLVAFFEYPSSIVLTTLIGLLATGIGGYTCMLLPKKSIINPVIFGALTLALNFWLWKFTGYRYGSDHQWILIVAAVLTIPVAAIGGFTFLRKNS